MVYGLQGRLNLGCVTVLVKGWTIWRCCDGETVETSGDFDVTTFCNSRCNVTSKRFK